MSVDLRSALCMHLGQLALALNLSLRQFSIFSIGVEKRLLTILCVVALEMVLTPSTHMFGVFGA